MGFMPGKSTVDAVFAVRQLVGREYGTVGKDLFVAFIDLEKAFDRMPREVIWRALRKKGVMEPEMRAVMEMYREAETAAQCKSRVKRLHGLKLVCIKVLCSVHCYLQLS